MERNSYSCGKMAGLLKTLLILILVLGAAFPALAHENNRQRIIPLDSDIYKDIDTLYLLGGLTPPSYARPWSEAEADFILSRLNPEKFSEAEKLAYDNIRRNMEKNIVLGKDEKGGMAIGAEVNLEAYSQTDNKRDEWIHGYEERLPLLKIPVEGWLWDSFYFDVDIDIKEGHDVETEADYDYCNFPEQFQYIDAAIPFRAFFSVGGDNWNVQYGRDKLSWGNGTVSNLLLSDYADYFNFLKFTTYWKVLKFTAVYANLDSHLTPEEKDIDSTDPGLTRGNYDNYREQYKAFMAHRLEARISDRLSVAASEAVIFGNKYPEMGNLNPFSIFHSIFAPEYSNVMASLEVNYSPLKGLDLYLQAALDEFQVSLEDSGSRPGALGYLGGAKYAFPLHEGFMTVSLEGAWTDPYLYNRWHPLTRFTARRRYWSYLDDGYLYVDKPIGYRYGPDAAICYLGAEYGVPADIRLGADLTVKFMGELNNSLSDPLSYETGDSANGKNSPSGTVEREIVVGFHGEKHINDRLRIGGDIYYINVDNYQNISGETVNDMEVAVHCSYKF